MLDFLEILEAEEPSNAELEEGFAALLAPEAQEPDVLLRLFGLAGDQLAELTLPPSTTVRAVRQKASEATGIPVWEQRLVLKQAVLADAEEIGSHGTGELALTLVRVPQHAAISWGADKTLKVWDLANGTEVHDFGGFAGRQIQGFHVDWRWLRALSWSGERVLRLWDVRSGKLIGTLRGHVGDVVGAAVNWEGSRALSWDSEGAVKSWDLLSLTFLELPAQKQPLRDLRVCWKAQRAVGCGNLSVVLWDLEKNAIVGEVKNVPSPRLVSVAPDFKSALLGSQGPAMQFWDLAELGLTSSHHHLLGVPEVEVDWATKRCLSWSCDGTLRLWNTGPSCATVWAQGLVAVQVDWQEGRALTWSYDAGGVLRPRAWELGSAQNLVLRSLWQSEGLPCMLGSGVRVALDWARQRALTWSDDVLAPALWDVATGAVLARLTAHTEPLSDAAVSWESGKAVTWSAGDACLIVWDLKTCEEVQRLQREAHGDFGAHVDFEWGKALVWTKESWGNVDFAIELWDLENGELNHALPGHGEPVVGAVVCTEISASETAPPRAVQNNKRSDGGHPLLLSFKSGELDDLIARARQILRTVPRGLPWPTEARVSGQGPPYRRFYWPVQDSGDRPRLLMLGDAITMGTPMTNSAPVGLAIANMGTAVFVEVAAWGGLLSFMLPEPGKFDCEEGPLPLPAPSEYEVDFAVVLIGTMDAIAIACKDSVVEIQCRTKSKGGVARLPQDWEKRCRPSVPLFEESLTKVARQLRSNKVRVALVTPPPLGEELEDTAPRDPRMRRSAYAVVAELAAAVHRVAKAEGCDVLPLFECCVEHLQQLAAGGRQLTPYAPRSFWDAMNKSLELASIDGTPWEDMALLPQRPVLCHDLVKLNETGGAIYAALLQTWLDEQLATHTVIVDRLPSKSTRWPEVREEQEEEAWEEMEQGDPALQPFFVSYAD